MAGRMRGGEDSKWTEKLERLRAHVEDHDGQFPRGSKADERKLAVWVNTQRFARRAKGVQLGIRKT